MAIDLSNYPFVLSLCKSGGFSIRQSSYKSSVPRHFYVEQVLKASLKAPIAQVVFTFAVGLVVTLNSLTQLANSTQDELPVRFLSNESTT